MPFFRTFALFAIGLVSLPSLATDPFEDFHEYGKMPDDEIHQKHKGEMLYGDVEFGFIVNKGNTQNTSFKFKSNLYQDFPKWRNQFKFNGLYRREQNTETDVEDVSASRYFGSAQGNYKLGDDNASFFMYGDYERDRFNGKEYTTTFALGYGNRVYEGRKNTVDVDIGPGMSISRVDNEIELEPEEDRTEQGQLLRMALQWERNVSKRTRFNQDVSFEQSLSGLNSRLFAESALVTQVIGGIALKFAFIYRYNSQPENEKEKVDTELGATLVYSFD
ncbi:MULTISPECIES: DUF481 domain-containing protein [unclassified Pseudoalteromonas]|uniref:DUF481 domain-containing protein n=1 Tax=unclassified Pseudoalteromonas TaxID=194690 RepID=UPI000C7B727D|nr:MULTISPECIES: DUF481 domain-containing protein [unclassified Pseudoalteromonas]MCF7512664.1 DUF481 domain-containing protein [Pseudoalteromonas sp. L7]MCF7524122.1 DUF481 domain-containing protein [Pseudoalteromonas sp. L23]AUJ70552.1 hypothetical protein PNC201_11375 [Pseudoalteromonas sp. NC201]MCF2825550.1 DUF481 domain-containing protein [Pseudoalteromonas sp. OF5H-5]MCF2834347.1 DUF481 domain-containing protein [Pseudoalteromonas sp. DL2-H6]